MPERKQILTISNLAFARESEPKSLILRNLNLHIDEGDRIGVIGPNGTGKTTLFLLISGVHQPTEGNIRLYDKPVSQSEFRPELGMVMQNQDDQIFCASVWEDIAFGPTNMNLSKMEVEERVEHAMATLHIGHLRNRPPHELSGGEKRLVTIAGIMAMEPKFVIYDEPTSNLDMRYRRRLIEFLKSVPSQDAMMIASHDLEFVLEVCNRVIAMNHGAIVADGVPEEIMDDKAVMTMLGMETPYSLLHRKVLV